MLSLSAVDQVCGNGLGTTAKLIAGGLLEPGSPVEQEAVMPDMAEP